MKKFILGLAIFTCTAGGTGAFAQTNNGHLVTLTGNLDPVYSMKVSEDELKQIAQGLNQMQMQPINLNINETYSKNELPAFEAATQEVSRVMVEAAKNMVDMRALIYKLDIALQHNHSDRRTETIYQVYNELFQTRFTTLLQLFLGQDLSYNTTLTQAMQRCYTENCMQDIADAQQDLVAFGLAINSRIDLDSSTLWEYQAPTFKSKVIKDAIQQTFDTVLNTNKNSSAYLTMVRAAAAPFAQVAVGLSNTVQELGNFIVGPRLSRYKIVAQAIKRSRRDYKRAQEEFDTVFSNNYKLIVSKGNGASLYRDPNTASGGAATSVGTNLASISPTLYRRFVELNRRMDSMRNSSTDISASTIKDMIATLLMDNKDEDTKEWTLASFIGARPTIFASLDLHSIGTPDMSNGRPTDPNLRSLHVQWYNGGVVVNGTWANEYIISDFQVKNTALTAINFRQVDLVSWAIKLYSAASKSHFVYVVQVNLNDYLESSSNGDKPTVKLNPPIPKGILSAI